MCLSTVNFSMTKRNGEFVGVGYKVIENLGNEPEDLRVKDGKILWKKLQQDSPDWKNTWIESKAGRTGYVIASDEENTDGQRDCYGNLPNKIYSGGFHIFLNPDDAQAYDKDGDVIKVEFKEVIAFGTNTTYPEHKPCVIANWMRVIGLHKV